MIDGNTAVLQRYCAGCSTMIIEGTHFKRVITDNLPISLLAKAAVFTTLQIVAMIGNQCRSIHGSGY